MSFLVGYALGLLGLTPAQAVTIAETPAIQNSASSTVAEALANPAFQTEVATVVVNTTPINSSSRSSSSASSTPQGMSRIQQIKAQLAEAAKGGPVTKTVINSVNAGLVAQRKKNTAAELEADAKFTKQPLKLTGIMLPPSLLYHPATISMPVGPNHSSSGSTQDLALVEMRVQLNGLEAELIRLQSMNKTPNTQTSIKKITDRIKGIQSILGKKGGKRRKQTRRKNRKSRKTHHH
jgi:hypothetical protein